MTETQAEKRYANPPLVEAVCEFLFQPDGGWDMTVPGRFYEVVRNDLPQKREGTRFELRLKTEETVTSEIVPRGTAMEFTNNAQDRLVRVAEDQLIVSQRRPYPGWQSFKPVILDILDKYNQTVEPRGLARVGLRYINLVEFGAGPIEMEDYFQFYVQVPKGLPQEHGAFIAGAEFAFQGQRDGMRVTLSSADPSQPEGIAISLDIEYWLQRGDALAETGLDAWLDGAHSEVQRAFESSITDGTRTMFGEVT